MKFSIRDLMFVTVIVALVVAWWVDRRRQADHANRLVIEHSREFVRLNNELIRERDVRADVEGHVEWLNEKLRDSHQKLLESVSKDPSNNSPPNSSAPAANTLKN